MEQNSIIKDVDSTDKLLLQIKNDLLYVEKQLDIIKISHSTTFTTGPVIKDANANDLIIALENTTDAPVTIKNTLIDYTKATNNKSFKNILLKANESQIISLRIPPLYYELIFEEVTNGIYIWSSTRTNNAYDSLDLSSFISSNTFRHEQFTEKHVGQPTTNFKLLDEPSDIDLCIEKIKNINAMLDEKNKSVSSTFNLISLIKGLIDDIINNLHKPLNNKLIEIDNEIKKIQDKIEKLSPHSVSKLTTGIVIKDISVNSIISSISNTTDSVVTINATLIDHTKVPQTAITKAIIVNPNSQTTTLLGEAKAKYEVVFDGITDGTFVCVSGRQNSATDPTQLNCLVASSVFTHNNLVEKF